MHVTGIEISQTAIDLAKSKMGLSLDIYHGSVSDMPFDEQTYDGIFCHAVIHLLGESERQKLIKNCYAQLSPSGSMIFTAISTKSPSYGKGTEIGPNRYEQHGGAQIFFYDETLLHQEFDKYGLLEVREIAEPSGGIEMPFLVVTCTKE
jgi:SAM-dependent methyltransferase